MRILTADLCDLAEDEVRVADPVFTSCGGQTAFGGEIATVKLHEDNSLVVGAVAGGTA